MCSSPMRGSDMERRRRVVVTRGRGAGIGSSTGPRRRDRPPERTLDTMIRFGCVAGLALESDIAACDQTSVGTSSTPGTPGVAATGGMADAADIDGSARPGAAARPGLDRGRRACRTGLLASRPLTARAAASAPVSSSRPRTESTRRSPSSRSAVVEPSSIATAAMTMVTIAPRASSDSWGMDSQQAIGDRLPIVAPASRRLSERAWRLPQENDSSTRARHSTFGASSFRYESASRADSVKPPQASTRRTMPLPTSTPRNA